MGTWLKRGGLHLGVLAGLVVASHVSAQQAPTAQNTQEPTSQNSPTSIGPDPFKAHDANISPRERVEEGAKTDAPRQADGSATGRDARRKASRRCQTDADGRATAKTAGEKCTRTASDSK
jgi:hypothetical protein